MEPCTREDLRKKFRETREAVGLTRDQVASMMDKYKGSIYNFESGRVKQLSDAEINRYKQMLAHMNSMKQQPAELDNSLLEIVRDEIVLLPQNHRQHEFFYRAKGGPARMFLRAIPSSSQHNQRRDR